MSRSKIAKHEKRESLLVLLRDLIEEHGEPDVEDVEWAARALAPPKGIGMDAGGVH